ncbi:hypothetical protein SK069_05710 [Patulibacter brassicae]|uniref:Uncharacterized protein n=1 Tax=Patulibacter brassicae TaxID=1705717 RepID=A0ABU4VI18_9ACTN|nr:hypothetical protein [Patulibacter brassicae]MDX8151080.1 hypothetical protein [Patulibacter brassicae]
MARRPTPDPKIVGPVLEEIHADAVELAELEAQAAAVRERRDARIRAALAMDVAPTHQQIADAAGLARGRISAYGRPAG